jgi:hypothetical protein
VHRHEEALADELVELEVVHVSALADLGRVDHHEEVVDVDVNPRHVVALSAVTDRHRVEGELLSQQAFGLGGPDADVEPAEAVSPLKQLTQLVETPAAHAVIVEPAELDVAHESSLRCESGCSDAR